MYRNELETGMIRGKRLTMISISDWLSKKVQLARKSMTGDNGDMILSLTLCALDNLKESIDRQVRNGVVTLDCSDFLPE